MNKLDYSPYFLDVEKALAEIYGLLKKNQYKEALELIDQATVDLRLFRTAVKTHVE